MMFYDLTSYSHASYAAEESCRHTTVAFFAISRGWERNGSRL